MKKMINLVLSITMVMGMLGIFAFDYVDGPITVRADGVTTSSVVTVEELQAKIEELEEENAYYKEWYVEPYVEDEEELRIRLDYHLKDARVQLSDGTYALRAVEEGKNIVIDDTSEVSVLHNYREEFMILPIENFGGQLKIAVTFDEGKTVELVDWGLLSTYNSLPRGEKVETGLKLKKLRKYNGIGRDHITLYKYVACVVEDAESTDGFDSAIRVKVHCEECDHNNAWECTNAKCVCTGCNCYTAPVIPQHCKKNCHASEEACKNAKCECTYCDCYTAPVIPQHCKKNCHASEEACKNAKCECTYCDCYDAPVIPPHCDCHDTEAECKRTGCTCECCANPDYNDKNDGFGDLVDQFKPWEPSDGVVKHCNFCEHVNAEECIADKCENCDGCNCYEAPKSHCNKCEHTSSESCIEAKCECTGCDCYSAPDYNDENTGFGDLVDQFKGWTEGSVTENVEGAENDNVWTEGSVTENVEGAEGDNVWAEGSITKTSENPNPAYTQGGDNTSWFRG